MVKVNYAKTLRSLKPFPAGCSLVAITREVIDGVIRDVIANLGKNHINNITETHKRWMIDSN